MKNFWLVLIACFLLCGCQNCVDYRGHFLKVSDFSEIKQNVSTKEDVRSVIGGAPLEFDEGSRFVYVGMRVERKAFLLPRITEVRGYTITFDPKGVVTGIYKMDLPQVAIRPNPRETVVDQENITFWDQLVNNYRMMSDRAAATN